MASAGIGLVTRRFTRLFGGGGTVSGLTEVQLLMRFLDFRDEAAFEAILARYGPVVLAVCRQLLDDPNDVDDAFQATFLILVRKASSLRKPELLGNWLYGVAHRVASRARADACKRREREKSAQTGAEEPVSHMGHNQRHELEPLHEELARLPEYYRAPVVLCYLEGLSHEEAARRLAWPLGSVKGRLSRARDLLRERLLRRGITPPAGALMLALGKDARSIVIPDALRESTIRAATAVVAGKAIAAGTVSATAVALSEGVMQTMIATKLRWAAAMLCTAAVVTSGAGAMVYKLRGQSAQAANTGRNAAARTDSSGLASDSASPSNLPEGIADQELGGTQAGLATGAAGTVAEAQDQSPRLRAAQALYETARAHFLNGSITIDRVVDASRKLADSEEAARPRSDARPSALQAHVTRMKKLADSERTRLTNGMGSAPNVALLDYVVAEGNDELARAKAEPMVVMAGGTASGMAGAMGGGMAAGAGGDADDDPNVGRVLDPQDDPEEEAINSAIRAQLNRPIAMAFPDDTPLEDVIKYIKSATASPRLPEGIPIYVEERALQAAEVTLTSPVKLQLQGVKLKRSLRLVLKQLNLAYVVAHGFLTVTNIEAEDAPWAPEVIDQGIGGLGGGFSPPGGPMGQGGPVIGGMGGGVPGAGGVGMSMPGGAGGGSMQAAGAMPGAAGQPAGGVDQAGGGTSSGGMIGGAGAGIGGTGAPGGMGRGRLVKPGGQSQGVPGGRRGGGSGGGQAPPAEPGLPGGAGVREAAGNAPVGIPNASGPGLNVN
jgi:RNA polymerase sigma factor (sigma-70 family)